MPSLPSVPVPPQGYVTSKTWVDPQALPVPNQPAPQQTFTAWPNQPAPQQPAPVWPNPRVPQGQGTLGDWADLKAPQPWSSAPPELDPALRPKRKGRGVVAVTLWVFAGGLFAGPLLADYADGAVEATMSWLATSAPGFIRSYLPKPVEAVAPAPVRAAPVAVVPVIAPEPVAQPQRRPEITVQPPIEQAAPSLKSARPAKESKARGGRGSHGKGTGRQPMEDDAAPVEAEKAPAEPKHAVDPFDGASEGGAPTKAQPAKSHESLDDLMADSPSAGAKAHDKRSASRDIDDMLKGVQKPDAQTTPKRAESSAAASALTASDISRVMGGVKSGAAGCGKRFDESGVAELKLTVGKDGAVSNVAIRGKLAGSPAGQCVVQAARGAVFPRNSGLTFDYRIDVR
jgi:hypothetical protein